MHGSVTRRKRKERRVMCSHPETMSKDGAEPSKLERVALRTTSTMDTHPRHTDERNRVDHAGNGNRAEIGLQRRRDPSDKRPPIKRQPCIGNPRKERLVHEREKTTFWTQPDAFEDSLRTPVPKGTEGAPTVAKRNLEVPAQRSVTEELLWKLYDLSCCCPSGPRRKATKNAERRGRNEGEEEKETRSTKNRRKNTKHPNQNRTPHATLGHISHEQFGQTVEPLLVKKYRLPVLVLVPSSPWVGARRSSGPSPAGGARLCVETRDPAFPQRRWYAHQ